jgi:hypothetical protein
MKGEMTMMRQHAVKILLLCLIAVMLGSCAGRRSRTMAQCVVPAVGACKACRVACPAGQTPKCIAGQGDEAQCNVPATCTCG